MGDLGSIPGLGRSLEEGNSYPLQYFGLENSMDCIVHGVTKSRTQLSNFHTSHTSQTSTSIHRFHDGQEQFIRRDSVSDLDLRSSQKIKTKDLGFIPR